MRGCAAWPECPTCLAFFRPAICQALREAEGAVAEKVAKAFLRATPLFPPRIVGEEVYGPDGRRALWFDEGVPVFRVEVGLGWATIGEFGVEEFTPSWPPAYSLRISRGPHMPPFPAHVAYAGLTLVLDTADPWDAYFLGAGRAYVLRALREKGAGSLAEAAKLAGRWSRAYAKRREKEEKLLAMFECLPRELRAGAYTRKERLRRVREVLRRPPQEQASALLGG